MNNFKHLLIALLATVAGTVQAQSSGWSIRFDNVMQSYTITRTDASKAETVHYRAVSLTAFEGKNFTPVYRELTFEEGKTNHDNLRFEILQGNDIELPYQFQTGTSRSFRIEVLDKEDRTVLASCIAEISRNERNYTVSTNPGVFAEKTVTEDLTMEISNNNYNYATDVDVVFEKYFDATAPMDYFRTTGCQMRMTVSFDAHEVDDGYQYIQILTRDDDFHDEGPAESGDPGSINYSRYMAGFEHHHGQKDGNSATYSFPVTSVNHNQGATQPWTDLDNYVGNLCRQKFRDGCRAEDGRLIIPPSQGKVTLYFAASGNGSNQWIISNIKAHIQAVDKTAPTIIHVAAPTGRLYSGSTTTVSLAFSEIVVVTGTPTITTSWGTLTYEAGSGTNVLSFSGTIDALPDTYLSVTALNGTAKDLAGNTVESSLPGMPQSTTYQLRASGTLADLARDAQGRYVIATKADLYLLATCVNGGEDTNGKTFVQTENIACDDSYTAIGTESHPFLGTYDGGGHIVSDITINSSNGYQGLFGHVSGGTVRGVVLRSCSITGKQYIGGIVGRLASGTVENCSVERTVTVSDAGTRGSCFGGIAGFNSGTVAGCLSEAVIIGNTVVSQATLTESFGGIVGFNNGTLKDCFYTGSTVTAQPVSLGVVCGSNQGTLTNNYYTDGNLTIGGCGNNRADVDGARLAHRLDLVSGAGISGTQTDYSVSRLSAIGSSVLAYQGHMYSGEGQAVGLTCSVNVPPGYEPVFWMTGGTTFAGYTLIMPGSNVIVNYNGSQVVRYTITYEGINGATFSTDNPTSYNVATDDFTLCNPTRDGYRFTGWTGTGIDGMTMTATISKGSIGDRTYTANWATQLILADGGSNSSVITDNKGKQFDVILQGRTLYKDGAWNTLCLPFDVSTASGPLSGDDVTAMVLNTAKSNLDGNGLLTLSFDNAPATITAGTPFIIKWDNTGEDITNPVFKGVTIDATASTTVTSDDGTVKFAGNYDPFEITDQNIGEIIFLGSGNTLGYSAGNRTLRPFRAHFEIPASNSVKGYQISFGDEGTTEILSIHNSQFTIHNSDEGWYSLDGRKLPGKPARKGIYIHNGNRVVIK